jgi:hypothetical protein
VIKVAEVGSDDASFRVVRAGLEHPSGASIARTLYPGAQIRVIFPIEPECFFVIDSAATVESVELETPQTTAG